MFHYLDETILRYGSHFLSTLDDFLNDPELFCESLPETSAELQHMVGVLKQRDYGEFSVLVEPTQFAKVLSVKCGEVVPIPLVFFAFERLAQILSAPKALKGTFGVFGLESDQLREAKEGGYLGGALFGYRFFCDLVRKDIYEILVNNKGETFTGTGFVQSFSDGKRRLVTCKHNLFDTDGTQFKLLKISSEFQSLEVTGGIKFENIDLAILDLAEDYPRPGLPLSTSNLLETVYSVGYPRIHLRKPSPLLFHRGEINGWTGSVEESDHMIVCSCDVAPGNSGGPLLNDCGQLVGIVTEKTETQYSDGLASYALATSVEVMSGELVARNVDDIAEV